MSIISFRCHTTVSYTHLPTTFYSPDEEERSFLISESVRGEGAKLYDKHMKRFVNELLQRDLLAEEIYKQMAKDGTDHEMCIRDRCMMGAQL